MTRSMTVLRLDVPSLTLTTPFDQSFPLEPSPDPTAKLGSGGGPLSCGLTMLLASKRVRKFLLQNGDFLKSARIFWRENFNHAFSLAYI